MNPEIVIAMYRPHEGQGEALLEIVRRHMPALKQADLVTDRPAILCRSEDGTILEIFEWHSAESARQAHEEPTVAKLWAEMMELADFPPLSELPEAAGRFPHFRPIDGA